MTAFNISNIHIQKKSEKTVLLLMFSVLVWAGSFSLSYADDSEFRVFMVNIDTVSEMIHPGDPVKDFYINAGKEDGLKKSMFLDVYREKIMHDTHKGEDITIRIYVGQLEIFKIFNDVAVARISSLSSIDEDPVLQYRTVMRGDYVVPSDKKKETVKSEKTARNYHPVDFGVSFPSHVLFAFDDWNLKPEARKAISSIHNMYNESRDKDIVIEGHTCNMGSDVYNLELSRKRALSVLKYLVQMEHIPEDRIRIEYYGERYPVAANIDERGREMNRRVDIRFLPGATKTALSRSISPSKTVQ